MDSKTFELKLPFTVLGFPCEYTYLHTIIYSLLFKGQYNIGYRESRVLF